MVTRGQRPEQEALSDRIRAVLTDSHNLREVSMFGGRAFMVDDAMLVSAGTDGSLLVRMDKDRHRDLLGRPGASQAVMGRDRGMGPGWISVAAEALTDGGALEFWIGAAFERQRADRR